MDITRVIQHKLITHSKQIIKAVKLKLKFQWNSLYLYFRHETSRNNKTEKTTTRYMSHRNPTYVIQAKASTRPPKNRSHGPFTPLFRSSSPPYSRANQVSFPTSSIFPSLFLSIPFPFPFPIRSSRVCSLRPPRSRPQAQARLYGITGAHAVAVAVPPPVQAQAYWLALRRCVSSLVALGTLPRRLDPVLLMDQRFECALWNSSTASRLRSTWPSRDEGVA